jgi:hypothetical protein
MEYETDEVRIQSVARENNGAFGTLGCYLDGKQYIADLAAEEFAACVSLNPIESSPPSKLFSVTDALNNGDIIIYIVPL